MYFNTDGCMKTIAGYGQVTSVYCHLAYNNVLNHDMGILQE